MMGITDSGRVDTCALALAVFAIIGGQAPSPSTGRVMPSIHATSAHAQSSPVEHQGFEYLRTQNPTRFACECCVGALENGTRSYIVVVDNIFDSPRLQQPLALGADIVVHSATKYLNEHLDMVGGIAVVSDNADLADRPVFLQNSTGGMQGSFNSFLALRGLKTLLFTLIESLGVVESPINHPGVMTHASVLRECRERLGISDALVRLIVGVDDVQDLRSDMERALADESETWGQAPTGY